MELKFLSEKRIKGRMGKEVDFIVREIDLSGNILDLEKEINYGENGEHGLFIVEKFNWNTIDLLKEYSKRLGVSAKRFGCAGNKDRKAVTTQLISCFKQFQLPQVKDARWKFAGKGNEVKMGDLLGNNFEIKAYSEKNQIESTAVNEIFEETKGRIPNYFGEQRFGSMRGNTAKIGEKIIRWDFRGAVEDYLTSAGEKEKDEIKEARKRLKDEGDYSSALQYFPKYLTYERTLLSFLAQNPRDHINALRKMPRKLVLMFVHAFQAQIFNEIVCERAKNSFEKIEGDVFCEKNAYGFPDEENKKEEGQFLLERIIGYELAPANEIEKQILEKHEVKQEDFKIKRFPEISSRGTFRPAIFNIIDFSFEENKNLFKFSIPKGSYATVVMGQFLE